MNENFGVVSVHQEAENSSNLDGDNFFVPIKSKTDRKPAHEKSVEDRK